MTEGKTVMMPRAGSRRSFGSVGGEGNLSPAPAAKIVVVGARVDYRRSLTEWYVNDLGLEQGFTFSAGATGPRAKG